MPGPWLCSAASVQPGEKVDGLADRVMFRLAYRNFGDHEAPVVNHTVLGGALGGIRWYELRNPSSAPPVFQQGTLIDPSPPGKLFGPLVLAGGSGVQFNSFKRWGDYSSMTIDPKDDCTFWYTQEYYAATGSFNGSTRIGAFRFDRCKSK